MDSQASIPNVDIRMVYELEGKEVVFEGTARWVEVSTQHNYEDINSVYSHAVSRLYDTTSTSELKAELVDGWKITTKEPVIREVSMQARVDVEDRTVDDFERARVQVGAPKNAKMRFLPNLARNEEGIVIGLDTPQPGTVEFVWKKKVRKKHG